MKRRFSKMKWRLGKLKWRLVEIDSLKDKANENYEKVIQVYIPFLQAFSILN
ncbi:MAG: hypothetical protein LBO06_08160 [Bacteroidales bacterium]|jgi:hypothetical protein|nr:hypothetical protein [Bacteroidales bacterium]